MKAENIKIKANYSNVNNPKITQLWCNFKGQQFAATNWPECINLMRNGNLKATWVTECWYSFHRANHNRGHLQIGA